MTKIQEFFLPIEEEVGEKHKIYVRKAPYNCKVELSLESMVDSRVFFFFFARFFCVNSCYPLVAFRKVALEAFPSHPWVVRVHNLAFLVLLPYPALAVQAKQEAVTEHTCSAVETHNLEYRKKQPLR